MSGGVDSSMAVYYLQKMDFEVIGVTLKMHSDINSEKVISIAEKFQIEHYFVDISGYFKEKVINYFTTEYKEGRTPSPCFYCNKNIKLPVLTELADKYGAEKVATGHYVRNLLYKNKFYIFKGIDVLKDQSYYLWKLDQEILQRMVFPLGDKSKEEVKDLAKNLGYTILAAQKESMGVCFLQNEDYREFLKKNDPEFFGKIAKGDVLNLEGQKIGEHNGYPFYTIGQKNNIDFFSDSNYYVGKIDKKKNILTAAEKDLLELQRFEISDCYFQDINDVKSTNITVRVRGLGLNPEGYGRIEMKDKRNALIDLEHPAWAMAPGQPVVFYIGDRVIGGGICK